VIAEVHELDTLLYGLKANAAHLLLQHGQTQFTTTTQKDAGTRFPANPNPLLACGTFALGIRTSHFFKMLSVTTEFLFAFF
jgi:hypothetical protein